MISTRPARWTLEKRESERAVGKGGEGGYQQSWLLEMSWPATAPEERAREGERRTRRKSRSFRGQFLQTQQGTQRAVSETVSSIALHVVLLGRTDDGAELLVPVGTDGRGEAGEGGEADGEEREGREDAPADGGRA